MRRAKVAAGSAFVATMLFCGPALAAAAHGLPGASMSWWWALPFAGLLLSIAAGPLLFHHVWENHYGKIAAGWAALAVVPMAVAFGAPMAGETVLHALLLEYMSFIILLFALFTISGGILVAGNIHGTPLVNTGLLLIGSILASVIGTTGAAMVMIRPMIRANDNRPFNGDPPLFIGFLKGVEFFWTTVHLLPDTLFVGGIVLAVFFVLDTVLHRREQGQPKVRDPTPDKKVRLRGLANLPLLAGVIAAILMSASWKPGIVFAIHGVEVELQNLVRDIVILALAFVSLAVSRKEHRAANGFEWGPIAEVAKLFAAIFVCIAPVVAILKAGHDGALSPLVALVTQPGGQPDEMAYFWLTGVLSSFLDNAPTYLVFFELAGGDPQHLMTEFASTLAAISAGAVFMGANTYIGNAPNFMVYAIARRQGIAMPSFFGYMLWSGAILIPVFLLSSFIFFG